MPRERSRERRRRSSRSRSRERHSRRTRSPSRESRPSRRSRSPPAVRVKSEQKQQVKTERKQQVKTEETQHASSNPEASLSVFGYSNEANPFNDTNLSGAFIWKAKYEQDLKAGAVSRVDKQSIEERRKQLQSEILKVKAERLQREEEEVQREEQRAQERREEEIRKHEGWEYHEEAFHRRQTRMRAKIRLAEGRDTAMDRLQKYADFFMTEDGAEGASLVPATCNLSLEVEVCEPYAIMDLQSTEELQSLVPKLKERVAEAELMVQAARQRQFDHQRQDSRPPVRRKKKNFFKSMGGPEPEEEEPQKVYQLPPPSDEDLARMETVSDFWRACLVVGFDCLAQQSAQGGSVYGLNRSIETDLFLELSEQSTDRLRTIQTDAEAKVATKGQGGDGQVIDTEYYRAVLKIVHISLARAFLRQFHADILALRLTYLRKQLPMVQAAQQALEASQKREQAPAVTTESKTVSVSVESDGTDGDTSSSSAPQDFKMEDTEANLAETVELKARKYEWSERYRPRKPTFINRVRTGFNWHKYNRAHYDRDNPPPKMVQGYKFNIFYPDLLDATVSPTYSLKCCEDQPDFCIIRFHAGPPYEDIAFKIVNKQWATHPRSGFRCFFSRGVLQLHFNFKRYFYRR